MLFNLKKIQILISGVCFASTCFSVAKPNKFQELIKPIDLENLYDSKIKTTNRKELYSFILGRNIELKQSRIDLDIAKQSRDLVFTQMFVPRTTLTGGWNQTKTVSSILSGSRDLNVGLSFGATTDIGLSYNLTFPSLGLNKDYNGAFNSLSSQAASAAAQGSVTFSLLRNSIFFSNGLSRESADLDLTSSQLSLKTALISSLSQAENSFYDILLQEMRCKVQERTLEASKALLDDVNEMIRIGDSDQLSRTKVEMQVSQAEVDLLSSRSLLNTAKASLRNQLAFEFTSRNDIYPDPRELYMDPKIPKLTLDEAISLAKKKRPDFITTNIALRRAQIAVDRANAQRMPQLDLVASSGYSANGENVSNAFDNLTQFGEMAYGVGLSFAFQFFEDADKFGYRAAVLNYNKAEMALTNINNQIWRDLSALLDNVAIAKIRLKNSETARILAERKISAEFLKFKSGESNVRNIVDFQFELANSRITEISARVDLQKLAISLRSALGELPEGIELR